MRAAPAGSRHACAPARWRSTTAWSTTPCRAWSSAASAIPATAAREASTGCAPTARPRASPCPASPPAASSSGSPAAWAPAPGNAPSGSSTAADRPPLARSAAPEGADRSCIPVSSRNAVSGVRVRAQGLADALLGVGHGVLAGGDRLDGCQARVAVGLLLLEAPGEPSGPDVGEDLAEVALHRLDVDLGGAQEAAVGSGQAVPGHRAEEAVVGEGLQRAGHLAGHVQLHDHRL